MKRTIKDHNRSQKADSLRGRAVAAYRRNDGRTGRALLDRAYLVEYGEASPCEGMKGRVFTWGLE